MSTTAMVSDKGQVTLPKTLRDRLGIRPGSRLEFRVAADGSLSVHVLATGSDALYGMLAKPGERTRSVEDMNAAVAEAVHDRSRRKR
jgi:AbrB family looped-hinge helix DNA binding protein